MALGHDPAWCNRVAADVPLAEITGQRTGESKNTRFSSCIGRHAALANHPRGRAEIDDDAIIGCLHILHHRLGAEELMLQIGGETLIPIFRCHIFHLVALIMRGIVDEHRDRANGCTAMFNGCLQCRNIGEVTRFEMHVPAFGRAIGSHFFACFDIDVDKGDFGLLASEVMDD